MASSTRRTVAGIGLLLLGAFLLWVGAGFLRRASGEPGAQTASSPQSRSAGEWYEHGNELLKRAKDYRGAAEAYGKAAELAPEMGEAHYGRGYALLELGDLEGAIPELESALSLAPANAEWRKDAENALVLATLRKSRRGKP